MLKWLNPTSVFTSFYNHLLIELHFANSWRRYRPQPAMRTWWRSVVTYWESLETWLLVTHAPGEKNKTSTLYKGSILYNKNSVSALMFSSLLPSSALWSSSTFFTPSSISAPYQLGHCCCPPTSNSSICFQKLKPPSRMSCAPTVNSATQTWSFSRERWSTWGWAASPAPTYWFVN